jgi:hypothetical protein
VLCVSNTHFYQVKRGLQVDLVRMQYLYAEAFEQGEYELLEEPLLESDVSPSCRPTVVDLCAKGRDMPRSLRNLVDTPDR